MEELYDDETNHSQNKLMQARWELYVDDILSKDYDLSEALAKQPLVSK